MFDDKTHMLQCPQPSPTPVCMYESTNRTKADPTGLRAFGPRLQWMKMPEDADVLDLWPCRGSKNLCRYAWNMYRVLSL